MQNLIIMRINLLVSLIINGIFNNDGISINLGGQSPTSGFMYSVQNCELQIGLANITDELVAQFIAENEHILTQNGMYLGAWVNDGVVYLDVSRNVNTYFEAVHQGMNNRQLAIYDVVNGVSVDIPEGQHSGTSWQNNSYNDMVARRFTNTY